MKNSADNDAYQHRSHAEMDKVRHCVQKSRLSEKNDTHELSRGTPGSRVADGDIVAGRYRMSRKELRAGGVAMVRAR